MSGLDFLLARGSRHERKIRIRELRLLAMVYFGPTAPVTAAFSAAVADPKAVDDALRAFERAPALPKRRLLSTWCALVPSPERKP